MKSIGGSVLTIYMYINWANTFNYMALGVSIIAGVITIGYTIDKWIQFRKDRRKNAKK